MGRSEHFDIGATTHLSHEQLAKAHSADWGGHLVNFPERAKDAWKEGDLARDRTYNYEDHGGPEGYARRVGGYRKDDQYDPHNSPIQVSHDDGELTVYDGHHRALDAVTRKVKQIPVEWV